MKRTSHITARPWAIIGLTVALAWGASSCVEPNSAYQEGPLLSDQCRRGDEVSERFDAFEHPDQLDILVVMDNSGSVERMQTAFAAALPDFLQTLDERGIAVRLGVVTTDMVSPEGLAAPGTSGEGCAQNTGAFADSESAGDWTRVAACNVVQGSDGDPKQQALWTIESSLVNQPGNLAEFFRPRARQLILVVSNEDDCSAGGSFDWGSASEEASIRTRCAKNAAAFRDIEAWGRTVSAQARTVEGIALAVLSGPPADQSLDGDQNLRPACQSGLGAAYPANRLWQATRYFGPQGAFESLCTDDLSFQLAAIADALAKPARMTLCPAERLVHEPLEVSVISGKKSATDATLGDNGFLYLGATQTCANGAISIAPGILAGADSIDMRYCVD